MFWNLVQRLPCRLVVFDMDGTLTQPNLDFDAIRREIGLESCSLLEALEEMDEVNRARALDIIDRHERVAAAESQLQAGALEVLSFLRCRGIRTAIATRNSRSSALTVLRKHGLSVDCLDTREDGPVKPAPDPVHRACGQLQVLPSACWMVGDYLYDVECGRRAGATTVLMLGERLHCAYADQADYVVHDLRELIGLIERAG